MRKQIEDTEAFKSMPQFKKNIYQSGKNIKHLTEQYIIANKIGYEEWKVSHSPSDVEDKIIRELLNN